MNQGLTFSAKNITQFCESASYPPEFDGADVTVRRAVLSDARAIFDLYIRVAHEAPGHLFREEDEVTLDYIHNELHNGFHRGLGIVIELDDCIIGYLNAYTSEAFCSAHVLTQASMMVDPAWQERGIGGILLEAYLQEVRATMPHIYRFELLPHQSNQRAIDFYEHHGFFRESEAVAKIRTAEGTFESEITLVWFNPNFSEERLRIYHAELDCQL